jgi:hypothetical protein
LKNLPVEGQEDMEKDFVLTILLLDELKEMGYEEVWLGNIPNPYCDFFASSNCILASPPRRLGSWPSVWYLSDRWGEPSCGNGLKEADNTFRSGVRLTMPGHYKIKGETWQS